MPANLQFALYGALMASFFLAAVWRPPVAIAAMLCMYGLKQWGQTSSTWVAGHGIFTNIAMGAVVLVALASRTARGKCVLCNIRDVTWVVIALYLYSLTSLLWTPRSDLALNVWSSAAPYFITGILLAPLAIEDTDDLYNAYTFVMLLGGTLVVALLLFAKWGYRGVIIAGISLEGETNPLAIANLGGAVATAALFLRPRLLPTLSWLIRLGLVGVALALVIKSESRGQLLAALAAMALALPIAFPLSRIRSLIPVVIAVAAVGFAAQYSAQTLIQRGDDRWSQADAVSATGERARMAGLLLSRWAQSPGAVVFGLGNSAALDPEIIGIYPHNIPVEILGEEGLVGFAIYLALNALVLRAFLQAWRATRDDPQQRRLLAVTCANLIFTQITTFKEGNMIPSAEYFMSAILLARMPAMLAAKAAKAAPASRTVASAPVAAPRPLFANLMR